MNSINGSQMSRPETPQSLSDFGNSASERMLVHRAYSASNSAAPPSISRTAARGEPSSSVNPSTPTALDFQGPTFNPLIVPPAVDLPSCVTWGFLTVPPPEDLPGLAMHAHQTALAVLDVHERLLAVEARNKCGWRTYFDLRRWLR